MSGSIAYFKMKTFEFLWFSKYIDIEFVYFIEFYVTFKKKTLSSLGAVGTSYAMKLGHKDPDSVSDGQQQDRPAER